MDISEKIEKFVSPFHDLIRDEKNSSYLLLATTFCALVIANSPLHTQYESVLHTPVGFHIGEWFFEKSLQHWVNDGLMALFFYSLGLEIKREFLVGELRKIQNSLAIIVSAAGGMIVPATIFVIFNINQQTIDGWGIPMATDAAFAVGILALLKSRVPVALVAFLMALAIIDDLGAILVIALFYTKTINAAALASAGLVFLTLIVFNIARIRMPSVYLLMGIILWFLMEYSGIHATVAGVAVAFTIPARPERSDSWVIKRIEWLLMMIKIRKEQQEENSDVLADEQQHKFLERLEDTAQKASTPLKRWERTLERPVILFVLPIFALFNAGIAIDGEIFSNALKEPLTWGIITGLIVGKPLGIGLFCWLSLKTGYGRLPEQVTLPHILGMAMLGGIGFTMSIFIAGLSFSSELMLTSAKLSIFIASIISGILGYCWLRFYATR